jgi:hypothetical protein
MDVEPSDYKGFNARTFVVFVSVVFVRVVRFDLVYIHRVNYARRAIHAFGEIGVEQLRRSDELQIVAVEETEVANTADWKAIAIAFVQEIRERGLPYVFRFFVEFKDIIFSGGGSYNARLDRINWYRIVATVVVGRQGMPIIA